MFTLHKTHVETKCSTATSSPSSLMSRYEWWHNNGEQSHAGASHHGDWARNSNEQQRRAAMRSGAGLRRQAGRASSRVGLRGATAQGEQQSTAAAAQDDDVWRQAAAARDGSAWRQAAATARVRGGKEQGREGVRVRAVEIQSMLFDCTISKHWKVDKPNLPEDKWQFRACRALMWSRLTCPKA